MEKNAASPAMLQNKYMPSCDIQNYASPIAPFVLVIFGGTGDLSQRKLLPSLFNIFLNKKLPDNFSILSIGTRTLSQDEYRAMAHTAIHASSTHTFDKKAVQEFTHHITYLQSDINNAATYSSICKHITLYMQHTVPLLENVIFYLAVSPDLIPNIIQNLNSNHLCQKKVKSKIVIEKPFGIDEASAHTLNETLLQAFQENQVYRIDHYLGKETVQNILFFRFGNSIFEPIWNRQFIDHVQITVAEDIGIEHRGRFYEQAGVVRDIIQNHMLQLIALVAMEPPVGFDANLIRDEKVKVFRTIRPIEETFISQHFVRGQYGSGRVNGVEAPCYRKEEYITPTSNTPTFFAGKFYIDNWRWANVPFYVRAGKRLPRQHSEIYVQFKQPPLRLFGRTCDEIPPNGITFNIQPHEDITMRLNVKQPGIMNHPHCVNMNLNYEQSFSEKRYHPYERLLIDCIKGDLTLFARQDGIEAMWKVVDPIIRYWDHNPAQAFPNYLIGTWGPEEAKTLIEQDGRMWHDANE